MAHRLHPVRAFSSFASAPAGPGVGSVSVPQSMEGKELMRGLNERLKDYLSQVKLLEETNHSLEEQIKHKLTHKHSAGERDWSSYDPLISTLKQQVTDIMMENARIMLQIDNARLAADDFKVKLETETAVRQGVDQDIASLRKLIDDTNMSRMQLECQVESLREELIFLNKTHEEDVAQLQGQIRASDVNVQLEASRGEDLNETIDNIRKQYEIATQKKQEETEAWYHSKFNSMTADVTRNTEELQQGKSELNNLQRQKQGLEIELQTVHNMNHSLEDTLKNTAVRFSKDMIGHNMMIQQLEAELSEVHAQVTRQRAEYQALLNIKSKLEEEINIYHHLLDGTGRESHDGEGAGSGQNDFFGRPGPKADIDIKPFDLPADDNVKPFDLPQDVKPFDLPQDVEDEVTKEDDGFKDSDLLGLDDESVEFSLDQALNAAPPGLPSDPSVIINEEAADEHLMAQKELELNAANAAMNEQYIPEEIEGQGAECQVILGDEVLPVTSELCMGYKEKENPPAVGMENNEVSKTSEFNELEKEELKVTTVEENRAEPEQEEDEEVKDVEELSEIAEGKEEQEEEGVKNGPDENQDRNSLVNFQEADEEVNSFEERKEENAEEMSGKIKFLEQEEHGNLVVDQEDEAEC